MLSEVGFVSHAIAALGYAVFAILVLTRRGVSGAARALVLASALTALWAALVAMASGSHGNYAPMLSAAETVRSAGWAGFLAVLIAPNWKSRAPDDNSRTILIAMAAVFALLLAIDFADELGLAQRALVQSRPVAYLFLLGRLAAAIGGLVLAHNVYVNAVPSDRWSIRLLCIALAGLFGYDLNLYTLQLLSGSLSYDLFAVRGAVDALLIPLFWASTRRNRNLKLQLSRQVVFHTLSLGAIGVYLVAMSLAAYGLNLVGGDWGRLLQVSFLFGMAILAVVVLFSGRFRAWSRVQINKHFFAYKYDYRQEWLRFIGTVSRTAEGYGDLQMRVIQSVCEIVDSPGGVLYAPSDDGTFELAARWNYRSVNPGREASGGALVQFLRTRGRIVNLDELRDGTGDYGALRAPDWAAADPRAWLVVPLLHLETLKAFIVIERSLAARELNWEDFDLLRTVGRQAASYIAEASGQAELLEARKFDEFNRRFAFIMHDIKNLVSQLSLVARNAERHADNPDFRADMVATLQSSVGKMNDLLARLSQHNTGVSDMRSVDLAALLQAAVAVAGQRHAAVFYRGIAGPLAVSADPARLEQVFAHLIQNAIDASAADAPVEVDLKRAADTAVVTVSDRGHGMSPSFVRTELFKPFQSTKAGGFGIGAYEAREIVRGLGGRLDVTSREGEGSMFTITLPLAESGDVGRKRTERMAG